MARMKLEGVGVAYPVYNAASQSLRKQIVSISTGGRVSAAKGHVATVQALDDNVRHWMIMLQDLAG